MDTCMLCSLLVSRLVLRSLRHLPQAHLLAMSLISCLLLIIIIIVIIMIHCLNPFKLCTFAPLNQIDSLHVHLRATVAATVSDR